MSDNKIPLRKARETVEALAELLRPACSQLEIAGSIRRGKVEVKDGEIVAFPTPDLLPLTDSLVAKGVMQKALYGEGKTTRWGNLYRGMLFEGMKIELFLADENNWGYILWLRTGPSEANQFVMRWLGWPRVAAPIRFQQGYGWYSREWVYEMGRKAWISGDRRKLCLASEAEVFAALGMHFVPPVLRVVQQYRSALDRRDHRWPDYRPLLARDPEQIGLFDTPAERMVEPELRESRQDVAASRQAYQEYLQAVFRRMDARKGTSDNSLSGMSGEGKDEGV